MFTTITNPAMLSSNFTSAMCSLPDDYNIALAELGFLLSIKYILTGSSQWEGFVEDSLNMGIFPLVLSFSWILLYDILSVL